MHSPNRAHGRSISIAPAGTERNIKDGREAERKYKDVVVDHTSVAKSCCCRHSVCRSGIGISLFMGAIFFPLYFLGGEEWGEVILMACGVAAFAASCPVSAGRFQRKEY